MNRQQYNYKKRLKFPLTQSILAMSLIFSSAFAGNEKISLAFNEITLQEVMSLLSKQQRVNILLSDGVEGRISVNLFDVTTDRAIRSIAEAAGFAVEYRDGNYLIVEHENVGQYGVTELTELRTYKIQYTDTSTVETILKKHLSAYGKMTPLGDRKMLVVEDLPPVLDRVEVLLKEIDKEPRQIFIEARIMEVTLRDNESFGLDWAGLFTGSSSNGSFGTQGLGTPLSPGFFFDFVGPNVEVALNALQTRGRLRTLSTPKLLAMENQEAQTIIGKNIGYQVTVTTNDVTTTSIEYLNSGIILKVTPSVDHQGRILLDIHPEVSDGTVNDDGVPSKTTTEVSTQMLVPDGKTVFIGGLIKHQVDETREGVPVLGDIPGIGLLFSNKSKNILNTETVVLITPKIVYPQRKNWEEPEVAKTGQLNRILVSEVNKADFVTQQVFGGETGSEPEKSPHLDENLFIMGDDFDY